MLSFLNKSIDSNLKTPGLKPKPVKRWKMNYRYDADAVESLEIYAFAEKSSVEGNAGCSGSIFGRRYWGDFQSEK